MNVEYLYESIKQRLNFDSFSHIEKLSFDFIFKNFCEDYRNGQLQCESLKFSELSTTDDFINRLSELKNRGFNDVKTINNHQITFMKFEPIEDDRLIDIFIMSINANMSDAIQMLIPHSV